MMTFFFVSQFDTYKYRSSGENVMPLGPVRSLLTSASLPSSRQ